MLAPLLGFCFSSDQLMKRLAARRYAGLLILSPPAAAAAHPATTHSDPQSQTADCSQVNICPSFFHCLPSFALASSIYSEDRIQPGCIAQTGTEGERETGERESVCVSVCLSV